MKKLMIAVAIVCAAAMSQAAQMKWGSSKMSVPNGTANVTASYGAQAAFYSIDSAAYTAIMTAIDGMSADAASKYIYDQYSKKTATKTATGFTVGANTITEDKTYAKNDTAYAVLIYTSYANTAKEGDLYFKANVGKWDFAEDTTKTQGNMGTYLFGDNTSDAKQALNWQTVPEPTSGLLLLLGVAGLALRRRRA